MARISTKSPPADCSAATGSNKTGGRRSTQSRTVARSKQAPRDIPSAAVFYAEEFGLAVFPVPPSTKKSYKSAKFSNGRRWGATNKPSVIERDFKRWKKANLGIPTGAENGIWVLEADTPKGHDVDGIASLRALERKYGRLPKTLMAVSPSGSLHYYFRYPKRRLICNSASKVAPGVDVRGEGGMVLAPPSVKEGVGQYRWLNWGTPCADAPAWLLDLVVRKPRVVAVGKASNGKASNPYSAADDADIKLIKAALDVITGACGYDVWFQVGCALHFELGDAGFELFDAWSATSPADYNAEECREKWRECMKVGQIGTFKIGTIIHYANEAEPGWRDAHDAELWRQIAANLRARASLRRAS